MLRGVFPYLVWPWIYHSPSLGLISISYNWTSWTTIADKNLWATEYYWESSTESNSYWDYYYRGSQSSVSDWGTRNEEDWEETQTPAISWYHIPTKWEWDSLLILWETIWVWTVWWLNIHPWNAVKRFLLLPFAWNYYSGWTYNIWDGGTYWSASHSQTFPPSQSYSLLTDYNNCTTSLADTTYWYPLRLFKDTPEAPDSTRRILYQPS